MSTTNTTTKEELLLANALYEIQTKHIPIPAMEAISAPKPTKQTLGFFQLEDARVFRDIVKPLAATVQEATFEGSVQGIHVREMDESHVSLIDATVPQAEFQRFEFVTVPENPIRFTVNTKDLVKRFRKLRKLDGLLCQVNSDGLLVTVGGRTEGIPLIEKEHSPTPLPRLTYAARVVFQRKSLKEILQKMAETDYAVRITTTADGVEFYAKGDTSFAQEVVERTDADLLDLHLDEGVEEVKSFYSPSYLVPILKSTSSETVTLEYSTRMPLRLTMTLGKYTILQYYLAPRVYSEEEETPQPVPQEVPDQSASQQPAAAEGEQPKK